MLSFGGVKIYTQILDYAVSAPLTPALFKGELEFTYFVVTLGFLEQQWQRMEMDSRLGNVHLMCPPRECS